MVNRSSSVGTRRTFLVAGAVGWLLSLLLTSLLFLTLPALGGLAWFSEGVLGTPLPAFLFLAALGLIAVLELPLVLFVLIRMARQGVPAGTLYLLHFGYVAFPIFYGALGALLTAERWWLWVMFFLATVRYTSSALAITDPARMAERHAARLAAGERSTGGAGGGGRRQSQEELLSSIRGFILDMDGVLYRGMTVREGAVEFVTYLNEHGIPYVCLTNNSSRTSAMYEEKLKALGIAIDSAHVLGAAQATAEWLKERSGESTRIFVVGEAGLREELRRVGLTLVDAPPADYVVVGIDFNLRYESLKQATLAIHGGATFIGTNPDSTFPSEEGLVPGNGAALAYLEAATGVPPTIIGKPSAPMMEVALEHLGIPRSEVAMVGDRLNTDILGGNRVGLTTILLLGGVTSGQELARSEIQPDLVCEDLAELLALYQPLSQAEPVL